MTTPSRGPDALTSGASVVELPRELVVGRGADRVRFLQGLLTADIAGTPVGQGRRAALLSVKGHVVADLRVFVKPTEIWMMVEAGQGAALAAALARYAIMDDFVAEPAPAVRFVGVLGPQARDVLRAASADPGDLPAMGHRDESGLWLARAHELGADGYYVGGVAVVLDALRHGLEAAGAERLPAGEAELARVAACEPRFGAEIGPESFPMEVGLQSVIDYGKGCYLGQETMVRIRDRGQTNYQLVQLEITDSPEIQPGDRIESDHRPRAGKVTSVVAGSDGRRLALAIVHASLRTGTTVRIHHGEVPVLARITVATAHTGNTPLPLQA